MTLAQQVFPDDDIAVKVGDTPIRIPRIETAVKIDAILDEEAWQKAVKVDANIEVSPGENIPAPVKTEAHLAYDMENLYIAIIAYDPDPSKIRAHISDRDKIGGDDYVLILFDTFNDQQRSYDFMCNPLGIQRDFIETPNAQMAFMILKEFPGVSELQLLDDGISFAIESTDMVSKIAQLLAVKGVGFTEIKNIGTLEDVYHKIS